MPRLLLQWMRSKQITRSHMTPSIGRLFSRLVQIAGGPLTSLRYVHFGGEPLRYSDVSDFRSTAPNATIVNCYGASETPQIMACHAIAPADAIPREGVVPIGTAIDDVQLLILDEGQALVADGVAGEIAVRTKYLSKGYLNEPGLTAVRFIRNPFGDAKDPLDRIYLTGDRGRTTAELGVEFSGRSDNQVKIRGFRVELEEVEMALRKCFGVVDAAAVIDSERAEPLLHAFVRVGPGFDASQCRKYILLTLPQYMVPTNVVEVGEFPLTPNGKLDRGGLLALLREPAK